MAYGAVNFNQFCQFDENKCRIFGRVVMEQSIKNSISLMGLGADLEFGSFLSNRWRPMKPILRATAPVNLKAAMQTLFHTLSTA